jgi:catechol 2,3-dioxygenase
LHAAVGAGGLARATDPVAFDDGSFGFACKDPEGRNLAFVCGGPIHPDDADQDRPRKITHVSLNTADFDVTCRFFTERLGFRVIDENSPLTFLHCANADHHSIVLARGERATLNHIAFEMPDLDSVMRGAGRMKDLGYPIEWGVGRHGPGNNVFAYFAGPDELPIEYTAEVLQVDDDYLARGTDFWKFPPGRSDQWGITGPRSARLMRVQNLFVFADGDALV